MMKNKEREAAKATPILSGFTEHDRRLMARRKLGLSYRPTVFANIGRHHEDYGMTPAEHAMAKLNRTPDSRAVPKKRSLMSRVLGR